jgi:hypothetical protein
MLLVMVDWFDVDICNFSFNYDLLLEFFCFVCKNSSSRHFIMRNANCFSSILLLFFQL